jgi:hypothetical protein
VLHKRDKQRLEAAQMRFLRPLLGYTISGRQRNLDTRGRLRAQSILEEIQTYQIKWKEHGERTQDEIPLKLALKYQPVEKRNTGHPEKRWKDQFLEES